MHAFLQGGYGNDGLWGVSTQVMRRRVACASFVRGSWDQSDAAEREGLRMMHPEHWGWTRGSFSVRMCCEKCPGIGCISAL